MKHRINLLTLILSTTFLFCFGQNSFAESTLVVGNSDSLVALTYTKYLDDRPVLLFTEQIEEWEELLDKVDNIAYIFTHDAAFYVPRGQSYRGQTLSQGSDPKKVAIEVGSDPKAGSDPAVLIDGEKFLGEVDNLYLEEGEHKIKLLGVDFAILEPVLPFGYTQGKYPRSSAPGITFRKINPTKYEVKVEGAKRPFWLVFSEGFHKDWRIYKLGASSESQDFEDILADYPKLNVKEAQHTVRFTPEDVRYLFSKPVDAGHYLVNGYANGWYIDPEDLNLDENFRLVIYFWPQSLFYLGLGILAFTLAGCAGYIGKKWLNF